jgi:hypothetical protein
MSRVPLIGGAPTIADFVSSTDFDADRVGQQFEKLNRFTSDFDSVKLAGFNSDQLARRLHKVQEVAAELPPIDVSVVDLDKLVGLIETIRGDLDKVSPSTPGGLALESVAVELGVTGKGDVGFIVANASVELSGKITVTFARPKP